MKGWPSLGNRENTSSKWSRNPDWYLVFLTGLTFAVGVITLLVFYRQFREMKIQTEILSTQAQQAARDAIETAQEVERQLAIAKTQADATAESVNALKEQNAIARNNFVTGQRPYIWVSNSSPPKLVVGQVARWDFQFVNYGKSPAYDTASRAQVVFGFQNYKRVDKDMFFSLHRPGTRHIGAMVLPGDTNGYSSAVSHELLTEEDIKYIEKHDASIVLIGHFEYHDLQGKTYNTEFCYFRFITGAIANCNIHNKVR